MEAWVRNEQHFLKGSLDLNEWASEQSEIKFLSICITFLLDIWNFILTSVGDVPFEYFEIVLSIKLVFKSFIFCAKFLVPCDLIFLCACF